MQLSNQAVGALMLSLQKSLMDQVKNNRYSDNDLKILLKLGEIK